MKKFFFFAAAWVKIFFNTRISGNKSFIFWGLIGMLMC